MTDHPRDTGPQRDAPVDTLDSDLAIRAETAEKTIAGRTPAQLARARLGRDKITMGVLTVVVLAVVVAVVAPLLSRLGVLDPNSFHGELIDPTPVACRSRARPGG